MSKLPYSGELNLQYAALMEYRQKQMANEKGITKRVFSYDMTKDFGGMPYLIWKVTAEKVINQLTDSDIMLTVKEYEVQISETMPVGDNNLAFPPNQFPNYTSRNVGFNNNNRSDNLNNGTVKWGRKKQYGRGAGVAYQTKQMGSGAVVHTRKEKRGKNKKALKLQDGIDVVMDFNNNSDGVVDADDSGHSVSAEGKSDSAQPFDPQEMKVSENYNDFGSRLEDTMIPQEYEYENSSPSNNQVSPDGPQIAGENNTLNLEPQNMAVEDIENTQDGNNDNF